MKKNRITKQDVEACLLLLSAMDHEDAPGLTLTAQWSMIWDELRSVGGAYTFAHYLSDAASVLIPPKRKGFTLKWRVEVTELALHLLDHLPLPEEA